MKAPVITGWSLFTAAGPMRGNWPGAPDRVLRVDAVDRASAHALFVAHRVLDRHPLTTAERDGLAVVVGTALGCAEVNESYHRGLVRGGALKASPMLFARTIPSAMAGEIALAVGARGHSTTLMAGRCSGIAALAEARRAIGLGRCASALVVTGDVFGPDRLPLLALQGSRCPAEAMVALLVEHPDAAAEGGRVAHAVLESASTTSFGEKVAATDPDWLGASGVEELADWLGGNATSFEVEVRCSWGFQGSLHVRRLDKATHGD